MRFGFTTGSCSAAAAKAAAYMLLSGREKNNITIETPKGIPFNADILDIKREENYVSCAVEKDGGDDPDVTTGAYVYARVSFIQDSDVRDGAIIREEICLRDDIVSWKEDAALQKENIDLECGRIFIDGGIGVGRVTRPGLDQPVGNAAINHVPREMIRREVEEVCDVFDYCGKLSVIISVPDGEAIAENTFNPRLGIVGGISILGTSGVVEPMSSQALLDTIRVELNQKRVMGAEIVAISPGNYGLDYMLKQYGYDLDKSVKCSNFIGETIDMAVELGFKKVLFTGHIGKLIKVSGGIMNTHSREADCRMELMCTHFVKACNELYMSRYESGDFGEQARSMMPGQDMNEILCKQAKILDCFTTEEAIACIGDDALIKATMESIMNKIVLYLNKRARGSLQIECIMYSNDFGELARSDGAKTLLDQLLHV